MSYCSENILPINTSIKSLKQVIELLGYQKAAPFYKDSKIKGCYIWIGNEEFLSCVEIVLSIRKNDDHISVTTESSRGRSYWDLEWQNKTINTIKTIFGGNFITTEGSNKYLSCQKEPSKISCSLTVCRYIFKDSISKTKYYFYNRNIPADSPFTKRSDIGFIDEYNPIILFDNIVIPYIIGCWDSYFRNSYISILKYSNTDEKEIVIKNANLSSEDYLSVIRQTEKLENIIADKLTFQRPSKIDEIFHRLNSKIDVAGWLRKPYHNRKTTLFDSITEIVEIRNSISHEGIIDTSIMDNQIKKTINDLDAAVHRVYHGLAEVYKFTPVEKYY